MRRTITATLAVLMMVSAAGCYGNAATDGAGTTRSRAYNGAADGTGTTRSRAYNGAYDGFYGDGNGDGFLRDGAHHGGARQDGMTGNGARHHGGTTRSTRRGGVRVRDGANYRGYKNVPPTVGGLDQLR